MTTNAEYKELFERKKFLKAKSSQVLIDGQDEANRAWLEEWKRLNPRKRKMPENYWQIAKGVPKETMEAIFKPIESRAIQERNVIESEIKSIDVRLEELVPGVEFSPTAQEFVVDSAYAGSYASQGYGANRYAERSLGYFCELLNANGFAARIDCIDDPNPVRDMMRHMIIHNTYNLVANCEPWMWDALFSARADVRDWDKWEWRNGVNPKVYTGGVCVVDQDEAFAHD